MMKKIFNSIVAVVVLTCFLAPLSAAAKLDEATKKEIDAYLAEKVPEKSWLPSMKGEMFELKGELEFEFVKTQNEEDVPAGPVTENKTDNKKPHLQLDIIRLVPIAHFGKHSFLKLEFLYRQRGDSGGKVRVSDYYFQSNYLLGEDAPADLWFRIGRDDRWMKPKRTTESYPILGNIAWLDDELQLVLGVDTDYVYWRGCWGSGFDLGKRFIGEDHSFEILQDDNNYTISEQKRELSTGLGFKLGDKDLGSDLLVYYINDKMNDGEDVDVLDDLPGYHKLESGKPYDKQHRIGSRLTLDADGARLRGEYLNLLDGRLKRHTWYTQLSYKQKLPGFNLNGRQWLVGITPLIRFDKLDVILDKEETDSRTWDRWGTTVALIVDVIKHVKLKNEYTWNREHTGGAHQVKNDEFLSQLEIMF